MRSDDEVEVLIWSAQFALLKKHAFPGSEAILASAERLKKCDEGDVLLTGSRGDFESLAGFVAGEANHSERDAELWGDLSDRLEGAI
jgi:hypothetical protein